jgi:hypothetical protein
VRLESCCAVNGWSYEVISEMGAGLNYRKEGLCQLISRIGSTWMRSENEGRMAMQTNIGGVDAKTVNVAYTSQPCPGYVSSDNRQRDMFHCRNPYRDCNYWQGDVDHLVAVNLKSRLTDRQISAFSVYSEVTIISRGSNAERKAELEHVSSLRGPPATVSEVHVSKTKLPLTARLPETTKAQVRCER